MRWSCGDKNSTTKFDYASCKDKVSKLLKGTQFCNNGMDQISVSFMRMFNALTVLQRVKNRRTVRSKTICSSPLRDGL